MKQHTLIALALSMLLGGLALFSTITRLSPLEDTGWLSIFLFFMSSLIFFSATFTLIGAVVRMFVFKNETYVFHFIIALRQGVLLTGFLLGFFGLAILDVATWWNILLLFASVLFVEMYFLNRGPQV